MHMFKVQATQFDAQIKSNAEYIQRMTDQIRLLIENQSYIPQGVFSDDTDEAFECQTFHDDTLTEDEAEQYQESEVSVQKPKPAKSRFYFYYSDSDEDEETELFIPIEPTTDEQTFNPQDEDLGACFTIMFDEDLPEPSIPVISENEDLMTEIFLHPQVDTYGACISYMTNEELNAEILK